VIRHTRPRSAATGVADSSACQDLIWRATYADRRRRELGTAGGAGSDTLDGGAGSDRLNGGSGSDTLIYNLSENLCGSQDVYTGGSGIDTILMQLSLAQWADPLVRAQLQAYLEHLATVKMNAQGEVSNGSASDFVFSFANGTTLTVQMMEKLAIAVQNASGQYVVTDYLQSVITGTSSGTVIEAGGVANGTPGTPTATGDLYADDLNGLDDVFQAVAPGAATAITMAPTASLPMECGPTRWITAMRRCRRSMWAASR
jgi:RTX calcium-binding nonapeptide repeat (4 copies)